LKLWVDDLRPAPDDSWDIAKNGKDAFYMMKQHKYSVVSLDHDMGEDSINGYELVKWMYDRLNKLNWPETISIHTANPVGRIYMENFVERYMPGRYVPVPPAPLPLFKDMFK